MRKLSIALLVLTVAGGLFAQQPAQQQTGSQPSSGAAASGAAGRFYGPIVNGSWLPIESARVIPPASAPGTQTVVLQGMTPQSANPCSVPLTVARIPDNVNYTIVQIQPNKDKVEAIPQAIVPAPSCALPAPR